MSHNKVLHNFWWKKHLSSILVANGYPSSFEQRVTKTKTASTDPPTEFRSTAVLPYVTGLSKQLCCCLQQQGECTIFKSETTLWSQLVNPKDAVDLVNQDGLNRISLWVWEGVHRWSWQTSAGENQGTQQGYVTCLDTDLHHFRAHPQHWTLPALEQSKTYWSWSPFLHTWVKEAIHLRLYPNSINRDSEVEIPEAWMLTAGEGSRAQRKPHPKMHPITAEHNSKRVMWTQSTSSPEED